MDAIRQTARIANASIVFMAKINKRDAIYRLLKASRASRRRLITFSPSRNSSNDLELLILRLSSVVKCLISHHHPLRPTIPCRGILRQVGGGLLF